MKKEYFLKRPFDFLLSFVGIVISSPLWLIISLLIWINDKGPVFYSQDRVGENGRIFKFIKFRSMVTNADKLKDELLEQNESQDDGRPHSLCGERQRNRDPRPGTRAGLRARS